MNKKSNDNNLLETARLPGRIDGAQASALLGFPQHDLGVLVAAKLLRPLGSPSPNSPKFYSAAEIMEVAQDRVWLDKATRVVAKHWQAKNEKQRGKARNVSPKPLAPTETTSGRTPHPKTGSSAAA